MADDIELAENRTFPAPPPFYKSFTKKNIETLNDLRDESHIVNASGSSTLDSAALQELHAPDEIRHLIPPLPPDAGQQYRVFQDLQDISGEWPTLSSSGVPQLFPSPSLPPSSQTDTEWTVDRVYYLKKLVRSILLNFLELMGTLSSDSSQWQEKFETLRIQFYNAHSLVNEYRGHQARETLILMMEKQLEEKRKEVEDIGNLKEKVAGILEGMQNDAPAINGVAHTAVNGTPSPAKEAIDQRKKEQRAMWQLLDAEMGT